jgi:hypothetical protein
MVWFKIIIIAGGLSDIRPKCTWRRSLRLSGSWSPAYDKQLRVDLTITDLVSSDSAPSSSSGAWYQTVFWP